MLAVLFPAVEQVPQLRPLALRIPVAKLVAVREYSLFCTSLFLVSPRPPQAGIKTELADRIEQRYCLQNIAGRICSGLLLGPPSGDRVGHVPHNQARA